MSRIAVLCGTGMLNLADIAAAEKNSEITDVKVQTNWGEVPIRIIQNLEGKIFFIDRHHLDENSRTPPHMIDHRSNVFAASSCNPDLIISINSVGSIINELPPGNIGIIGDIIDLTQIPWTFHDSNAVHSDRTSHFNSKYNAKCSTILDKIQGNSLKNLVIAQCVGPQYESPAEIDVLEKLGANVVGMTLGPESRLISETEFPHIALACSSNWAAGRSPKGRETHINHNEVNEIAEKMIDILIQCIFFLQTNIE